MKKLIDLKCIIIYFEEAKKMRKSFQLVKDTLRYKNTNRIPMVYFNRDKDKTDILMIDVIHHFTGIDKKVSEWGVQRKRCDKSMGQPTQGIINSEEELNNYQKPNPVNKNRFLKVKSEMEKYPEKYYLASLGLSGFTIMACLRGFSEILEDMYLEEKFFEKLADVVFEIEEQIIIQLKEQGFDDWGTQEGMIISPKKA